MKEELDLFFEDFAETVVVLEDGREFLAIFDSPAVDTRLGDYQVEAHYLKLTCLTAEVESLEKGEQVGVRGVTFEVLSNRPDGRGISTIGLEASV